MVPDAGESSDAELLTRSATGDTGAFGVLMQRHEDRIFGLCLRILGDRADALDATQDTFIAAFRQAASFRGDSALGTWLYRIGANACKDLLRKKKRWVAQDSHTVEDLASHRTRTESRIEVSVTDRLVIRDALARLPDEYREAVVMHDLGGIPYDEIATLTETHIGTVKSRISRGRRRLAELLEHPSADETSKEVR
ncbi:MAG: sigma-70 family RNA polymerase sigma factor [Actinomycetota bacterium]|nr:sigma-70 family RNA polymerase sigma factor [Actinomycetota bacterium]